MKQQEVFNKIGGILHELSEQYEYLKTLEAPLNELELELFLANAHFLTDHTVILNKLNRQALSAKSRTERLPETAEPAEIKTPEPIAEPRYFEPLVQSSAPKKDQVAVDEKPAPQLEIDAAAPEDTYSYVREEPEPELIRHELILDEADLDEEDEQLIALPENEMPLNEIVLDEAPVTEIAPPEKPVEEKKEEVKQVITEPVKTPETIAPPLDKEEPMTINERISAQLGMNNGWAGQQNAQPISDLKTAISLNEKHLFVKDLFNGYNLAYSEAVEILNRFASFDEADLFLKKNYVVKNNWESKPDTMEKFYALLKRRYA